MKHVLIIHSSYEYVAMFQSLGFAVVKDIAQADLVCFTGGADVTPSLYGDKSHAYTGNDPYRDKIEQGVFDSCVERGIPMVGICRGGQFLNVMSGGRMYQHVDKHCGPHAITDLQTGDEVFVSSTHHQMMMPASEALLVASSTLGGAREWFDGAVAKRDISNQDIEVVFYEKTQCLCFQPHPEFTGEHYKGMRQYFFSLLQRFFHV